MTNASSAARGAADKDTNKDKLRVWLRLLRTARGLEAQLRERLRTEFDTTMPRFDVMSALARSDAGLTMGALSRQLLVSNGNVTGIVERLVADGQVIRRTVANDRRTTVVCLSAAGAADFDRMAAAHETWVAALLAGFGAADVAAVMPLLAKMSRAGQIKPEVS